MPIPKPPLIAAVGLNDVTDLPGIDSTLLLVKYLPTPKFISKVHPFLLTHFWPILAPRAIVNSFLHHKSIIFPGRSGFEL
ncbi:MAG: hypothetical protein CM15mP22_0350 [Gammaproteobacteria bacterium]|nr:MAG: hypothetical protein CM15mP22_0350 [Gammaproteobacteria bacterium]